MLYVDSFNTEQLWGYTIMTCIIITTNILHTRRPEQSLKANSCGLTPETWKLHSHAMSAFALYAQVGVLQAAASKDICSWCFCYLTHFHTKKLKYQ